MHDKEMEKKSLQRTVLASDKIGVSEQPSCSSTIMFVSFQCTKRHTKLTGFMSKPQATQITESNIHFVIKKQQKRKEEREEIKIKERHDPIGKKVKNFKFLGEADLTCLVIILSRKG